MTIIGHAPMLRELRRLAASDDPPHALVLAGPEHTGRTAIALDFAMTINCEALPPADTPEPCGQCRPCRLIAEGAHPDVVTLAPGDALCRPREGEGSHPRHPDSRDIRICQVRGLIDLVARFPFEARTRVILIDPAERLNIQAANNLLKTLEEPPGHTVFLLLTSASDAVLETILSRCRRVDVSLVPRPTIEEALRARDVPANLAVLAAEASHGRPGLAITYAAHPDLLGDRDRLLARFTSIAGAGPRERFRYAGELADRWRRDRLLAAHEFELWESFWEARLRESVVTSRHAEGAAAGGALRALAQVRTDLLAQVQAQLALEFLLLSFPRVTLTEGPLEASTNKYA